MTNIIQFYATYKLIGIMRHKVDFIPPKNDENLGDNEIDEVEMARTLDKFTEDCESNSKRSKITSNGDSWSNSIDENELVRALDSYSEPGKGNCSSLMTFSFSLIGNFILDIARDNHKSVRMPNHQNDVIEIAPNIFVPNNAPTSSDEKSENVCGNSVEEGEMDIICDKGMISLHYQVI